MCAVWCATPTTISNFYHKESINELNRKEESQKGELSDVSSFEVNLVLFNENRQ